MHRQRSTLVPLHHALHGPPPRVGEEFAMTEFFQSLGMSYEWAWGVATVAGILLIALPLMLAVAIRIIMMIVESVVIQSI